MKYSLKKIAAASLSYAALTFAPMAHAALVTFDIEWSNDSGVAIGFGELTLDSSLIAVSEYPAPGISISQIQALNVRIQGAEVGNGNFTKNDFSGLTFYSTSALNLSQQLVGQAVTVHRNMAGQDYYYESPYGISAETGMFNLYSDNPTVPHTVAPFAIITDSTGPYSDFLHLTSILARPSGLSAAALNLSAVPEPETYALLLAGLGVTLLRARRKR